MAMSHFQVNLRAVRRAFGGALPAPGRRLQHQRTGKWHKLCAIVRRGGNEADRDDVYFVHTTAEHAQCAQAHWSHFTDLVDQYVPADTCDTVDPIKDEDACLAPPAWDQVVTTTCYACGLHTCKNCSRVRKYHNVGRKRLCRRCITELQGSYR